jgi:hypothetical protein
VLVVLAVVALVVAAIAWFALADDDSGDSGHDPKSPASSQSAPVSAEPSTAETVTADGMESFIEDYLAAVTTDPRAAWEQLTPEFQKKSGGFGKYKKFWSDFESADVIDAQPDPETMTIEYTVEYLHEDGSKSTDDVKLRLEGTDGNFLIAGES